MEDDGIVEVADGCVDGDEQHLGTLLFDIPEDLNEPVNTKGVRW